MVIVTCNSDGHFACHFGHVTNDLSKVVGHILYSIVIHGNWRASLLLKGSNGSAQEAGGVELVMLYVDLNPT